MVIKMNPVTHGVIGLALSSFSSEAVALNNPLSLGCAIGAMIPDIDVIARIKGDYVYLKHHRGISHSIPSLIILAVIITKSMSYFFADFNFFQVFLWTFIGCLSHTLFDILNSYGAKLLMPFSRKKAMVGILMLYDPVITVLCLLLILENQKSIFFYGVIVLIFALYLETRRFMKKKARKTIEEYYRHGYKIIDISVLPALMAFYKWDFVVSTNSYNIVGQINSFNKKITERKKFKRSDQEALQLFQNTKIGRYFEEFTPIYHVARFEQMGKTILKCTDLRYYLRNNFMHHATVIYDRDQNIVKSFFHPYSLRKNIPVVEEK